MMAEEEGWVIIPIKLPEVPWKLTPFQELALSDVAMRWGLTLGELEAHIERMDWDWYDVIKVEYAGRR